MPILFMGTDHGVAKGVDFVFAAQLLQALDSGRQITADGPRGIARVESQLAIALPRVAEVARFGVALRLAARIAEEGDFPNEESRPAHDKGDKHASEQLHGVDSEFCVRSATDSSHVEIGCHAHGSAWACLGRQAVLHAHTKPWAWHPSHYFEADDLLRPHQLPRSITRRS